MLKLQELIDFVFTKIPSVYLIVGSTLIFLFMGILAFFVRARSSKKPISPKRIILPPLFMSSGALMFLFEEFRVPFVQVIEASAVGLLFSILLIKTTNFEFKDNEAYLKQSKVFIFVLLGLLIFRLVAKLILSSSIDVGELAGMFWIVAFAMILPWRIGMLVKFNKIRKAA